MGTTQTQHERAIATDLVVDNCLSEYTQPAAGAGGGDRGGGAGGDVWLEAVEKLLFETVPKRYRLFRSSPAAALRLDRIHGYDSMIVTRSWSNKAQSNRVCRKLCGG